MLGRKKYSKVLQKWILVHPGALEMQRLVLLIKQIWYLRTQFHCLNQLQTLLDKSKTFTNLPRSEFNILWSTLRWYLEWWPNFMTNLVNLDKSKHELHIFFDASESTYGFSIYAPYAISNRKIPLFAHRNSRIAPKNLETLPGLALCAMNIAPKTNVILRLLYLGKKHSLFTSKLWDLLGPQQLLIKPNVGFVISQKPNKKVHEHNIERKEALNCIVPQVQKEAFSDDIQSSICRVTICVLPCHWSFFVSFNLNWIFFKYPCLCRSHDNRNLSLACLLKQMR